MKTDSGIMHLPRRNAYTLIEVMVSVAITSILFVSLYAGFASGFGMIQVARENLRATQILEEKMETLRLYTWDQINSNGFIPTSFSMPFDPFNTNSTELTYTGKVTISSSGLSETYSGSMKRVKIELGWVSGDVERSRQMETFVSRYGLQNYIY